MNRDYAENGARQGDRMSGMSQYVEDAKRFLKETRIEMTKVTWPSRLELRGSTILVILVSLFFAVYIATVDLIITNIIKLF